MTDTGQRRVVVAKYVIVLMVLMVVFVVVVVEVVVVVVVVWCFCGLAHVGVFVGYCGFGGLCGCCRQRQCCFVCF